MADKQIGSRVSDTGSDEIDWGWVSGQISAWFSENARDLPWRREGRSGYHGLVSEAMLQQTQVSRVVISFARFVERFPDVHALAAADEAEVLEMWSGLGYYRRARSLHNAAKQVVDAFSGSVPSDIESLMSLPGVGRYTAGAIASIVYDERVPIVDGNVIRVLTRLLGDEWAADEKRAIDATWERAGRFVDLSSDPSSANEGLMELGATVCTKASPSCGSCPLRSRCVAHATDRAASIPLPKQAVARQKLWHQLVLVSDNRGRVLMEQRGEEGLWAGLWQPIGEDGVRRCTKSRLSELLGVEVGTRLEKFVHLTTHREVVIEVYEGEPVSVKASRGEFVEREAVFARGLSSVHTGVLRRATE